MAICQEDPERLREVWRELRNISLTLAADLPAAGESLDLLRRRLAADQAALEES